jgi:CRP/FNR family transcriptional regulator, cyclic AMP receptor protein
MPRTIDTARLFDADPDLGVLLSEARREQAQRTLVVRTQRLRVGAWDVTGLERVTADHLGLLIVEGVLSRELRVADVVSTELLGPGDLVRPWPPADRMSLLPADAVWAVLSPARLAVLDRRFAADVAHYPEVTAALFDRLSERSVRLATTQAISQLTCVDRRLTALFWHLAERWGRVSTIGVVVPLALTHRLLGQLVGARRPTVSTALSKLADRGELTRRPDGSWLLRSDPPDADALAREPGAGAGARERGRAHAQRGVIAANANPPSARMPERSVMVTSAPTVVATAARMRAGSADVARTTGASTQGSMKRIA